MFGIDVYTYCPHCKKYSYQNLGITSYVDYKGESYAIVYCNHCKTKLAAKTIDAIEFKGSLNNNLRQVHDNTNVGLIRKIEEKILISGYDDKTKEEVIEKEIFDYAISLVGEEIAYKYEYEIKYVIQFFMVHNFNVPNVNLVSHIYEDIEKEITNKHTICW